MSGSLFLGDNQFQPSLIDPTEIDPVARGISRRASLAGVAALAVPGLAGQMRPIELGTQYFSGGRSLGELTGILGAYTTTSTKHGPYGNRTEVLRALKDLGASFIRSKVFTGNKWQVEWINQLGAAGIKVNALSHSPGGRDTPEQTVNLVATSLRSAVMSIEGANEWNLQGGRNWASELRAHQARLYKAAKDNPVTRPLKVVGPALAFNEGFAELGNCSANMDWGNIHLYPNGFVPGDRADMAFSGQHTVCGSKPIMVTETGWHNAVIWHGVHYYTPEDIAGVYAPRLVLEYFIRNATKVDFYELIDEPDARNPSEASFGLLRANLSRKPAFDALANMHTILTREYRDVGRPTTMKLRFRRGPSDLRSALVNRGDGRFLLFLWRSEASLWDPKRRARLTPTPGVATIDWGTNRSVRRFAPASSANAIETKVTSVSNVSLGAELQILEVSPV